MFWKKEKTFLKGGTWSQSYKPFCRCCRNYGKAIRNAFSWPQFFVWSNICDWKRSNIQCYTLQCSELLPLIFDSAENLWLLKTVQIKMPQHRWWRKKVLWHWPKFKLVFVDADDLICQWNIEEDSSERRRENFSNKNVLKKRFNFRTWRI